MRRRQNFDFFLFFSNDFQNMEIIVSGGVCKRCNFKFQINNDKLPTEILNSKAFSVLNYKKTDIFCKRCIGIIMIQYSQIEKDFMHQSCKYEKRKEEKRILSGMDVIHKSFDSPSTKHTVNIRKILETKKKEIGELNTKFRKIIARHVELYNLYCQKGEKIVKEAMLEIQWFSGNDFSISNEDKLEYYYSVLKIDKNSSLKEIRIAYYSLSLYLHPDRNRDKDTTKQFQLLNEAYTYIKNHFDEKNDMYFYMPDEDENEIFATIEDAEILQLGDFFPLLNRKARKQFEYDFLNKYDSNEEFKNGIKGKYLIFKNMKYMGLHDSISGIINKSKKEDKIHVIKL